MQKVRAVSTVRPAGSIKKKRSGQSKTTKNKTANMALHPTGVGVS
jgi:hypothetical protein